MEQLAAHVRKLDAKLETLDRSLAELTGRMDPSPSPRGMGSPRGSWQMSTTTTAPDVECMASELATERRRLEAIVNRLEQAQAGVPSTDGRRSSEEAGPPKGPVEADTGSTSSSSDVREEWQGLVSLAVPTIVVGDAASTDSDEGPKDAAPAIEDAWPGPDEGRGGLQKEVGTQVGERQHAGAEHPAGAAPDAPEPVRVPVHYLPSGLGRRPSPPALDVDTAATICTSDPTSAFGAGDAAEFASHTVPKGLFSDSPSPPLPPWVPMVAYGSEPQQLPVRPRTSSDPMPYGHGTATHGVGTPREATVLPREVMFPPRQVLVTPKEVMVSSRGSKKPPPKAVYRSHDRSFGGQTQAARHLNLD